MSLCSCEDGDNESVVVFLDPITLEEIGNEGFVFSVPNGLEIHYSLKSIAQYFIQNGTFTDPVTRIEWSRKDVNSLEASLNDSGYRYENLYDSILKRSIGITSEAHKSHDLLSLERCAGEIIAEVLKLLEEKSKVVSDQTELRLLLLLTQLESPFREMKAADIERAFQVWSTWINFIQGPKLRPTKERGNTLKTSLSFIQSNLLIRHQNRSLMVTGLLLTYYI